MANRLNRSIKNILHKKVISNKKLQIEARQVMEKQFKIAHGKLMNDFDSHPVTRELESGAGASNITGTLSSGNLFGFIGFAAESNPTQSLRSKLNSANILIKHRKMSSFGFVWTYVVNSPSLRELYKLSPMPWAKGASWLKELEGRGIPNLGQYIYKDVRSSRSEAGFQNKNLQTGGRVKVPYIKELLQEFEKNLNSISASRVSKSNF
jgi:hypothetical protein